MSKQILDLSATELIAAYRAGALSPVAVVQAVIARAEAVQAAFNPFQLVDPPRALAEAEAAAERWRTGRAKGALDGVPISIKDIVATAGWPTLKGSRTIDPAGPWDEDCPAVARLREAGAILYGKTTTPEFGWKGMTDAPLFGITRNPWDGARTPGGSSGGAAVAVATGLGPLALGTDGGGSIRIPSSYCGLFGIKPTFGRVPHHPQEGPFCTLVAGGPIARTVADLALMLNEIAKPDQRDWYALPYDGRDYTSELSRGVEGLRIAFSLDLGGAAVDEEVGAIVERAAARFGELGAAPERVGTIFSPLRPDFEKYWLAGFGQIVAPLSPEKRALLEPRFRALAEQGEAVTLGEYAAAVSARARLGATMARFFEDYDLLVTPTMPTVPPPVETLYHGEDFDRWTKAVPFTLPFNLTGQPAASVPAGLAQGGLPVGLQIVAAKYRDDLVLRAAAAYEPLSPIAWPNDELDETLKARGIS